MPLLLLPSVNRSQFSLKRPSCSDFSLYSVLLYLCFMAKHFKFALTYVFPLVTIYFSLIPCYLAIFSWVHYWNWHFQRCQRPQGSQIHLLIVFLSLTLTLLFSFLSVSPSRICPSIHSTNKHSVWTMLYPRSLGIKRDYALK